MGADVTGPAEFRHTTVLLDEAVDGVLTRPDGVYVDGTFGRGGHSRALLARLGQQGGQRRVLQPVHHLGRERRQCHSHRPDGMP